MDESLVIFLMIVALAVAGVVLWLVFRHQHQWGEWEYESDNSCLLMRKCQDPKCDAQEMGDTVHQGEWHQELFQPQEKYTSLLRRVYQILDTQFDQSELKELCLQLDDVYYEDLPGESQKTKAKELVLYLERQQRIPQLIQCINTQRDDIHLEEDQGIPVLSLPENFGSRMLFDVDPQASCTQTRVCNRCKQQEYKEDHQWTAWTYESDTSCLQSRICQLCGKHERQEAAHIWSEWLYESSSSCQLVRKCQRCSVKERGEIQHEGWSDWDYDSADSCQKVRRCVRCDKPERGDEEHDWDDWEYDASGQQIRRCNHCGAEELGQNNRDDTYSGGQQESRVSPGQSQRSLVSSAQSPKTQTSLAQSMKSQVASQRSQKSPLASGQSPKPPTVPGPHINRGRERKEDARSEHI